MHPKVCDEELASQRTTRRCSRPPHFPRHTVGRADRGGGLTLRLLAGRSKGVHKIMRFSTELRDAVPLNLSGGGRVREARPTLWRGERRGTASPPRPDKSTWRKRTIWTWSSPVISVDRAQRKCLIFFCRIARQREEGAC